MRLYSPAWYSPRFSAGPEFAIGRAVALSRRRRTCCDACPGFRRASSRARCRKFCVGGDDGAVQLELDHGLRAVDRRDLAGVLHAADLLRGDVGRELDDLDRLAVAVEHRIVGRLDPDLLAALADALVFGGLDIRRASALPRTPGTRRVSRSAGRRTCCDACPGSRPACSPCAFRKFSLAVMMVPSRLNSMTACERLDGVEFRSHIGRARLLPPQHCSIPQSKKLQAARPHRRTLQSGDSCPTMLKVRLRRPAPHNSIPAADLG